MLPEPHDNELDVRLADLASAGSAEGFAPGFLDRVMGRIDAERATPVRARITPIRMVAAAAVVLALATSAIVIDGLRWRTVTVPAGRTLTVDLADGSHVALQAGSVLRRRPFRFRSERRVLLEGEAFLDVVRGERPFVVETFNADVVVMGTRFNVRAWPDDVAGETAVALVEGSVSLRTRGPSPAAATLATAASGDFVITAGETARVSAGSASRVDDAPSPSESSNWTSGGLSFRDRPLADVLRALERRYAVRIQADPSVTRGRTATYLNPETPELADVLDALSFALGLRYGRRADGWVLTTADGPIP